MPGDIGSDKGIKKPPFRRLALPLITSQPAPQQTANDEARRRASTGRLSIAVGLGLLSSGNPLPGASSKHSAECSRSRRLIAVEG